MRRLNDDSQAFQWTEKPRGGLRFLALASHRHLRIKSNDSTITADEPGAEFDRQHGASFTLRKIPTSPTH